MGIWGLPFGSLETKCHLNVGLMERHIIYHKGEGGGFPQVNLIIFVSVNNMILVVTRFGVVVR